ncbi:MAG: 3-deoxy-D-manno-octulosonic acid transferase [Qingshengfaniella sp.]
MAWSSVLAAYRLVTAGGDAWARRKLARRLAEGKEHSGRLEERMGRASVSRPEGPLIWFHAASVGESLALLELIRLLLEEDPALTCLITTGTVTSSEILAARMPERCLHQFVPLDLQPYVRGFLAHWRPDLAVWTESELWPNLILDTRAAGIPLVMLNARLSDRSIKRWQWAPRAARTILSCFDLVQAQDQRTAAALARFGVPGDRLQVTGSLKEGSPPLACDEAERSRLTRLLQGRLVWLAASTHPGEDEMMIAAHMQISRSMPRLMMILAPRHPARGDAVSDLLTEAGVTHARRSRQQDPDAGTQVLLADTMGEMGLWYRLAPVSFVGGSLVDVGGHNPFEPAALGSAILHGPHVDNFEDIYSRLDAAGGARAVARSEDLPDALDRVIRPDISAPMALAAWEISSEGADVTDRALAALRTRLPGLGADPDPDPDPGQGAGG